MTNFDAHVNQSGDGVKTTSTYDDRGDGTDDWFEWTRLADGGDVAQGDRSDAAVTSPVSDATVIALLKGILTRLGTGAASGVLIAEDTAAVSGDLGVRVQGAIQRTVPVADAADGDYGFLHTDGSGRLQVAPTGLIPGYPPGATPLVATSGNVAAAVATATLGAAASVTTYITGFMVTGAGATSAANVTGTISNLIGSITGSFTVVAPAGITTAITPVIIGFPAAIPASATNTAIAVSVPSLGSGNTHMTVTAFGYRI